LKTAHVLIGAALVVAAGAAGYVVGTSRHAGDASAAVPAAASGEAAGPAKARKVLYYRNPMGLPDTSPTPKKDPMGMDYIPVYEGEDEDAGGSGASNQIRISAEKVQKLGVRTEAAALRRIDRSVRASGRVEPDERRVVAVAPRFEGWVEKLHVNVTGQPVAKGQPLFEVYSPEMVSAQREYAIALEGMQAMKDADDASRAGMRQLAESSLLRMRNWELSPEQIDALVKGGQVQRTVTVRSPVAGIVTEKKALQGMRFMPGEMLYQITDLSSVWVLADVAEMDIGAVRAGTAATVRIPAYPARSFSGRVAYVYPTLNAETRTVPVRLELANPAHLLKPSMFAQVEMALGGGKPVLTVPDSAVIDSGARQLVLVRVGEGRFEAREVQLGERGASVVEVLKGVQEGEQVVVAANFLIDAESNLRAAVGGLGSPGGQGTPAGGAASGAAVAAAAISHKASGVVEDLDPKAPALTLKHEPVASLKWPAMSMEFAAANSALLSGLKPGQRVEFEFVQRQPGEFVVTAIAPAAGGAAPPPTAPPQAAPPAKAAGGHSGH
jgi:Cu(I)/Ag(I) efflux system membrane fusion protein